MRDMRRDSIRAAVALVVFAGLLTAGARRIGPAPALGPFLEPAHGAWSLARSATMARGTDARLMRLGNDVTVVYDDRAVPHIFATTEEDAYRALGYVVARDRLFQLSLQTLAATGRLTEIAGARALVLDREMRGLGLPRAAERAMAAMPDSAREMRFTRAYADGVNAYMEQAPPSELPLEFRLTGTRPEPWTPIDSYHLFNRMGYTLAYLAVEHDRAAAAARVGTVAAAALFPDSMPLQEPIQPNGQTAPRPDFKTLPAPGAPDSTAALLAAATDAFLPSRTLASAAARDEPLTMASNNWAVSPRRSANGHALLAGDPHLDLSLPSIWYEVHLVVPGVMDVYGVTIPGAPGVVIGFNRDVAWTFTNTGVDVVDYYAEQVDDDAHPTRYRLDGAWRSLEQRVERYRGQHGETVATDTLYFTHRGPMQRVRGRWLSMRWTVLEAGREIAAFHDIAHARSTAELEDMMARSYQAPAQNMLAADRAGHIGIRSNARFPVRPADGSGGVVRDGTRSASDWTGQLPVSDFPQSFDPAQGYLASANQQPIDPRAAHGWWGGSYDQWRALRINVLLRADSAVTPDAMRRYQTDAGSARADLFVPYFLSAASHVLARGAASDSAGVREAAALLAQWNRRYTRDNERAVLFEAAMRELTDRTWDELITDPAHSATRSATPNGAVLAELLADSSSAWWDDHRTRTVEQRDDILAASLDAALIATRLKYGAPASGGWRWSRIRHAVANHLLRIPALSAVDIPVQGGPGTLSPSSGTGSHAASWRMVVDLGTAGTPGSPGTPLRAWSTYPGGQSGNPASAFYRDRIGQWSSGTLGAVRIPATPAELDAAHRAAVLVLHPAR